MTEDNHRTSLRTLMIWVVVTGVVLYFFLYCIDPATVHAYPMLLPTIGAICSLVCFIGLSVSALGRIKFRNKKFEDNSYIITGVTSILGFLAVGAMMIWNGADSFVGELNTYGIRTMGVVTDKTKLDSPKGGHIQDCDIYFLTLEGRPVQIEVSLTNDVYGAIETGDSVKVVYSSRNPVIADIIFTREDIERKQEERFWEGTPDEMRKMIEDNKKKKMEKK